MSTGPSPWTGPRLPWLIGAYFAAHAVARALGSSSLEMDEAEQVLLTQALQWGYSGQPPLYVWLQALVFSVLGPGLVGIALLKNGLLLASYLLIWLTARRALAGDDRLAGLVALSWLFVPQIVWESQRDLSHSVTVLTLASATLYAVSRGLASRGLGWYALYGVLLALGLLSKYNYVVFAAALNGALLLDPRARALVLDPRVLLTLAVALALAGPHLLWVAQHPDIALDSGRKLAPGGEAGALLALGRVAWAALAFLTPLWAVYLLFFPRVFPALLGRDGARPAGGLPLGAYLGTLAGLLAAGAVTGALGDFKDRWMQPLLFVTPLYFFLHAAGRVSERGVRGFTVLAAGVAGTVLLVMAFRAPIGAAVGLPSRLNVPFDELAATLRDAGFGGGLVVASSAWVGGNLLARFPGSVAAVPGLALTDVCRAGDPGRAVLVWEVRRSAAMPHDLAGTLAACRPDGAGALAPPRYVTLELAGSAERKCFGVATAGFVGSHERLAQGCAQPPGKAPARAGASARGGL